MCRGEGTRPQRNKQQNITHLWVKGKLHNGTNCGVELFRTEDEFPINSNLHTRHTITAVWEAICGNSTVGSITSIVPVGIYCPFSRLGSESQNIRYFQ
jgi:hypothetical protein